MGHDVSVKVEAQGDDWDTDPDFVVSVWCGNPQCWWWCEGSAGPWHMLLSWAGAWGLAMVGALLPVQISQVPTAPHCHC